MTEQLWSPAKVADVLIRAEDSGVAQTSILAEWDGLDLAAAYEAQDIALQMRISRGERVTGVKLGVTSKAKQRQVGVDSPSTAWLTDAMILPIGEPVPREKMIHARAEPEIAFVMGRRLEGPGVSAATALAAVDHVVGAIEIIDSRFSGYKFSMMDAVADNNSSGRTSPVPSVCGRTRWTSVSKPACSKWTVRSSIRRQELLCTAIPRRRWLSRRTPSPSVAWRSSRAG